MTRDESDEIPVDVVDEIEIDTGDAKVEDVLASSLVDVIHYAIRDLEIPTTTTVATLEQVAQNFAEVYDVDEADVVRERFGVDLGELAGVDDLADLREQYLLTLQEVRYQRSRARAHEQTLGMLSEEVNQP